MKHIPFAYFLVANYHPRLIVELGVHTGNSLMAFAQGVKNVGYEAEVVGVDHWIGDQHAGIFDSDVYDNLVNDLEFCDLDDIVTLKRKSFNEALVDFSDGSIDLLHIDGYHTYDAVRHDFETWLPKLSNKAIVLIHDIRVEGEDFGVYRYWDEVKQLYPYFEFNHSYGLGVLFVGKNLSASEILINHGVVGDAFRLIFESIGDDLYRDPIEFAQLFIDTGSGFNENESITIPVNDRKSSLVFSLGKFDNVEQLRFDPAFNSCLIRLDSIVLNADGDSFKIEVFNSNALSTFGNYFVFDQPDSNFQLSLEGLPKVFENIEIELQYIFIGHDELNPILIYLSLSGVEDSTLTNLEQKVYELQYNSDALNQEIDRLKDEKKEILKVINDQKAVHDLSEEIRNDLKSAQVNSNKLNSDLYDVLHNVDLDLKNQIRDLMTVMQQLSSDNVINKNQIEVNFNVLEEKLSQKFDSNKDEVKKIISSRREYTEEFKNLTEAIKGDWKNKLNSKEEEIKKLQRSIVELEKQHDNEIDDLKTFANSQFGVKDKLISNLQQELERQRSESEIALAKVADEKKSEINKYDKRIELLGNSLKESINVNEFLLNKMSSDIKYLEESYNDNVDCLKRDFENDIALRQAHFDEKESQYELIIMNLEERVKDIDELNSDLENKIISQNLLLSDSEEAFRELHNKIDLLNYEIEFIRTERENLLSENQSLNKSISELHTLLEEERSNVISIRRSISGRIGFGLTYPARVVWDFFKGLRGNKFVQIFTYVLNKPSSLKSITNFELLKKFVKSNNRELKAMLAPIEPNSNIIRANSIQFLKVERREVDYGPHGKCTSQLRIESKSASSSRFKITGWAIAQSGISTLEFKSKGQNLTKVEYGLDRPDVHNVFPKYLNSDKSGFSFSCDIEKISDSLEIIIKDNNGVINRYLYEILIKDPFDQIDRNNLDTYAVWILNNTISSDLNNLLTERQFNFDYRPKISIVMPVYNVEIKWLKKAIDSILNQIYPNWQLCIADDKSTQDGIVDFLEEQMRLDDRINVVFREENGNISEATNSALSIADGEFVLFMDNDDELAENAIYEIVAALNQNRDLDVIYSDEDKIDENGKRYDPFFKPDWSPELFLSYYYLNHLTCVRKSVLDQSGPLRTEYNSCQDWDLLFRVTSITDRVHHIPKVLYHWRAVEGSIAKEGGAKELSFEQFGKCINLVKEQLEKKGLQGTVYQPEFALKHNLALVDITWPDSGPLVSILIPSKDHYDTLKKCIDSIKKTAYKNYEIIILDNDSKDKKTLRYLDKVKKTPNIFVETIKNEGNSFSFAYINNEGAKRASGELLLFLNDDTEVISDNWLSQMVGYHSLEGVEIVGARLLYSDGTIQHAGVINNLYVHDFSGLPNHAFLNVPDDELGYAFFSKVTRNYSAVTAACMLMSKSLFAELEGFDKLKFPVAYNDIDLCLRVFNLGKRIVYCSSAVLMHYESKSRKSQLNIDEPLGFKNKYRSFEDPYYNINLSKTNPFELAPFNTFNYALSDHKKPNVVLVTHNLNYEGAPIQLLEIVKGLILTGDFNFTLCSAKEGPLRGLFEEVGIEVEIFDDPVESHLSTGINFEDQIGSLSHFISSLSPDVIFVNTLVPFYLHEISGMLKVPSIWLIHEGFNCADFYTYLPFELYDKALRSFMTPYSVVFVSKAAKGLFNDLNFYNNFITIKNAVDEDRFVSFCKKVSKSQAREMCALPDEPFVFLNLGTICQRKGQIDFVDSSIKLLNQGFLNCKFVLVGARRKGVTGDYLDRISVKIEASGYTDHFLIIDETAEVEKYFRAADVFVCSSYNETYGRVVMEAMLCNLPIISTPVLGLREVSIDNINSRFYSPGDINGLFSAMKELLTNESLREQFAKNSIKVAELSNTSSEVVEKYAELIRGAYESSYSNRNSSGNV